MLKLELSTTTDLEERSFKIWDFSASERAQSHESGSIPVQILSPFDHAIEELYLGRFRKAVLQDYVRVHGVHYMSLCDHMRTNSTGRAAM